MQLTQAKEKNNFKLVQILATLVLSMFFLSGCGLGGDKELNLVPDAETGQLSQQQIDALLEKVSMLMEIPTNEDPLVATITDAEVLRAEQEFYRGVIDGDMLIIFPSEAKAVIYSPSQNKIINAGPVFAGDEHAEG